MYFKSGGCQPDWMLAVTWLLAVACLAGVLLYAAGAVQARRARRRDPAPRPDDEGA